MAAPSSFQNRLRLESEREFSPFYLRFPELRNAAVSLSALLCASVTSSSAEEQLQAEIQRRLCPKQQQQQSSGAGAGTEEAVDAAVSRFNALLDEELSRIDRFSGVQVEGLRSRLRDLFERTGAIDALAVAEESAREELRVEADAVGALAVKLDRFILLNYEGFLTVANVGSSSSTDAIGGGGAPPATATENTADNRGSSSRGGSASRATAAAASLRRCVLGKLATAGFNQHRFDKLVPALSTCYANLSDADRLAAYMRTDSSPLLGAARGGEKAASSAEWQPPSAFQRRTTKYWVAAEDMLAVKLEIVKHLPVLIFGQKKRAATTTLAAAADGFALHSKGADWDPLDSQSPDSSCIASDYLDRPGDLPVYHERIRREEGATLVRIRRYIRADGGPSEEAFVERKVHHDSWTTELSVKERFRLRAGDVGAFLAGSLDLKVAVRDRMLSDGSSAEDADKALELATAVSELVRGQELVPALQTEYYRTAFQLSTSNAVRVSLDCSLRMLSLLPPNSDAAAAAAAAARNPSQPPQWPFPQVQGQKLVEFPYGVLEVKLSESDTPAWRAANPPAAAPPPPPSPPRAEALIEGGLLRHCPKFSKFLHGSAALFPDWVRAVPPWLPDFGPVTVRTLLASQTPPSAAGGGPAATPQPPSMRNSSIAGSGRESFRSLQPPPMLIAAAQGGGGAGGVFRVRESAGQQQLLAFADATSGFSRYAHTNHLSHPNAATVRYSRAAGLLATAHYGGGYRDAPSGGGVLVGGGVGEGGTARRIGSWHSIDSAASNGGGARVTPASAAGATPPLDDASAAAGHQQVSAWDASCAAAAGASAAGGGILAQGTSWHPQSSSLRAGGSFAFIGRRSTAPAAAGPHTTSAESFTSSSEDMVLGGATASKSSSSAYGGNGSDMNRLPRGAGAGAAVAVAGGGGGPPSRTFSAPPGGRLGFPLGPPSKQPKGGLFRRLFAAAGGHLPATAARSGRGRLASTPMKIEPKTFFANERTMLQWLQSAAQQPPNTTTTPTLISSAVVRVGTMLLFTGLTLLSFSGADTPDPDGTAGRLFPLTPERAQRLCGIILGPFAVIVMMYALWIYLWRARRISRRDATARYDDCFGPTALVVVLLFVSSACVGIALSRWAIPHHIAQSEGAGAAERRPVVSYQTGGVMPLGKPQGTPKRYAPPGAWGSAAPPLSWIEAGSTLSTDAAAGGGALQEARSGGAHQQQQLTDAADRWPQSASARDTSGRNTTDKLQQQQQEKTVDPAAAAVEGGEAGVAAEDVGTESAAKNNNNIINNNSISGLTPLEQDAAAAAARVLGTGATADGGTGAAAVALGAGWGGRGSAAAALFRPPSAPACPGPVAGLSFAPFAVPRGLAVLASGALISGGAFEVFVSSPPPAPAAGSSSGSGSSAQATAPWESKATPNTVTWAVASAGYGSVVFLGAFSEGRQVLLLYDASSGEFLGSKVDLSGFLLLTAQARQQRSSSAGGAAMVTAAAGKEEMTALATAPEMGLIFAATSAGDVVVLRAVVVTEVPEPVDPSAKPNNSGVEWQADYVLPGNELSVGLPDGHIGGLAYDSRASALLVLFDRADPAVVRQWDLAAGTVTAEWPMAANSAGGGGWSGLALVESPTTAAAGGGEGEKQAEAELLLLEASPPPQIWRVGMTQTAGAAGGTAPNSGGAGGRAVGKRLACTPGRSAV